MHLTPLFAASILFIGICGCARNAFEGAKDPYQKGDASADTAPSETDTNATDDSANSDSESDSSPHIIAAGETPMSFAMVTGGGQIAGQTHKCTVSVGGTATQTATGASHRVQIGMEGVSTPP